MTWKRAVAVVLAVLLVLVLGVVGAFASAFVGNATVEDGRSFADGRVVTVLDGYVACYLVDTGGGTWAMVDACQDPATVTAALQANGVAASEVQVVLLTHGHGDHTGGIAALSGVPVRALAAEVPLLEGRAAYHGPVTGLMGKQDTGIRVTEPLADGARIAIGDTTVEVFAAPGHTAGSAAYLVHGVLLMGDSAGYKTSGRLAGAPWVFSDDTGRNIASLRALAARLGPRAAEVQWLAPAHTGPVEGISTLAKL